MLGMPYLRDLRIHNGLSMAQLGDMVGKAESTISKYESGQREPDNETLLKLSEALNASADYLLRGPVHETDLSIDEMEFIRLYRKAKPAARKIAQTALSMSNEL